MRKPRLLNALRPLGLLLCLAAGSAGADTVRVAVASNFATTLEQLQPDFERQTGHRLVVSAGSSGRHYAQIINGAPFDVFLSADADRVKALESAGRIDAASRRPYALGRLALWTRAVGETVTLNSLRALAPSDRVALANPRLAPYGLAAEAALISAGLSDTLRPVLVMGENVGQTFQFAFSGSARYAFVALAQVLASPVTGSYGLIPDAGYQPIVQEMAILRPNAGAQALFGYLSDPARAPLLEQAGYYAPNLSPTNEAP